MSRPATDAPGLRQIVTSLPLIRTWKRRRYWRRFARTKGWQGLFYGLYESFPDALRAAPPGADGSFALDHDWYIEASQKIEPLDYPIIDRLRPLIEAGTRVFDFGGHIGLAYYNYQRFIPYPDDMRWVVCEIPQVVALGREFRERRCAPHLEFETSFEAADGASIFFSAGCIQYVETRLAAKLGALRRPPRHVLLNKVPLYDMETRVTLQNTGASICPYWLFNRREFVDSVAVVGYELVDEWPCPERSVRIGVPHEYRVLQMSGLYFRLRA